MVRYHLCISYSIFREYFLLSWLIINMLYKKIDSQKISLRQAKKNLFQKLHPINYCNDVSILEQAKWEVESKKSSSYMRHIRIWPKSPALNFLNSLLQFMITLCFNNPTVLQKYKFFENSLIWNVQSLNASQLKPKFC